MVVRIAVKHALSGEVLCCVDVDANWLTVHDLKRHITEVEGTPICSQRLLSREHELHDEELLSDIVIGQEKPSICFLRVHPEVSNANLLIDLAKGHVKLEQLPAEFRDIPRVALAAFEHDPGALEHVSKGLQDDRGLVLAALTSHRKPSSNKPLLAYVSEPLQSDYQIVRAAVLQDGRSLQFASTDLRNERELVHAAVHSCGHILTFASQELKADAKLVVMALGRAEVLCDIGERTHVSNDFMAEFSCEGDILQCAAQEVKADRDIVLTVLQWDGLALQHAALELRNDEEIVSAAMRQNVAALQYASDELKHERWFATLAVVRNWRALEHLPKELKADRKIVCFALRTSWLALNMAHTDLQCDYDLLDENLKSDSKFLLAAIAQDSRALRFASHDLQHDRSFIEKAVSVNGRCLRYAVQKWKSEEKLVLAATIQVCGESSSTCLKQTGHWCLACSMVVGLFAFCVCFTGGV